MVIVVLHSMSNIFSLRFLHYTLHCVCVREGVCVHEVDTDNWEINEENQMNAEITSQNAITSELMQH